MVKGLFVRRLELVGVRTQIHIGWHLANCSGSSILFFSECVCTLGCVAHWLVAQNHIGLPEHVAIDWLLRLHMVIRHVFVVLLVVGAGEVGERVTKIMIVLTKAIDFFLFVCLILMRGLFFIVVSSIRGLCRVIIESEVEVLSSEIILFLLRKGILLRILVSRIPFFELRQVVCLDVVSQFIVMCPGVLVFPFHFDLVLLVLVNVLRLSIGI